MISSLPSSQEKIVESKKSKKEENGAGDDYEEVDDEEDEVEGEEEYDLPFGEEDLDTEGKKNDYIKFCQKTNTNIYQFSPFFFYDHIR